MRVVIIGGGFTGAYVAKKLEKTHDVTLIDTKDYFEYTPGILRALVEPQHTKKIQILHERYLKNARTITTPAEEVTSKAVKAGDEEIPYDILVLASGSRYNKPFKQQNIISIQRARTLRNHHKQIRDAKNILVVGGGIVGVELTAEIKTRYPHKHVMIAHSRDTLAQRCCPKAQKLINGWMNKKGVELILNERIKQTSGKEFKTENDRTIEADYAFLCIGITPNSECVKDFLTLDEKGFVTVDEQLKAQGHKNIFVGGDVAGVAEEKLAQNAEKHARTIVENIKRYEKKKPLKTYERGPRITLISLGKHNGTLSYGKACIGGLIPAALKALIESWTIRRYD